MFRKWIRGFVSPPSIDDAENADVVFILHSITFWGIPVLLFIVAIRMLSGDNRIDPIHAFIGIVILTFLLSRIALHRGYFRVAGRVILIVAWLGITYLAWISDGLQNNALIPYMTIILASALLLGEVDTVILSAFCIAAIWGIAYADTIGLRISDNPKASFDLAFNLTVNYSLSTVAVYYMIRTLRKSFDRSQKELVDRRQMQAALHENEEKFRKVFHYNPLAICICSFDDGRLLEANYAYWDFTGLNPDEPVDKKRDKINLWGTPDNRAKFIEQLKDKGSYYNPDFSFVDGDGTNKQAIGFFELIDVGDKKHILSMFYDMSEQRKTMNALQDSESRVRTLLEAIPDMILELTLDGLITNMIPPKGMEASLPSEDYIGKQIYEVFSENNASQILSVIEGVINGEQIKALEFEENLDGNMRSIEARFVASTSDTALMILRDITQRKQIEAEREKLINELETQNRESETLRQSLASIVTTFDIEEVLERILDQMKLVIPYDTASVWRIDGEWQILFMGRDLPPEIPVPDLKFRVDEENSSRPILLGETKFVLSTDVQNELPDFKEPHSYINSWLAVPLKIKGNITGLIALDGKQKDQFNEHHAELAVTFADQVAIAFENASLFSELQVELEKRRNLIAELEHKNLESETLRESTAIVASSLDISETVDRVLEQIKHVVNYDSASVWLYQDEKAVMVGSNGLPPGADEPGYYVIAQGEPDYGFWEDKVPYILIEDIQEKYPNFREPPLDYIHGWMAVPLRAHGKLIGFISMDSHLHGRFTVHDAELALSYSNHVAVALEKARLFSELQSELDQRIKLIDELELKNAEAETLRDSTAIVAATLERQEAIERILDQLKRVVPYDSASVQLIHGDSLEIVGGTNLPLGDEEIGSIFKIDQDEPAYPILAGEFPYVLYNDVQEEIPGFNAIPHDSILSWLAVPLKVKEKIVGVIALDGMRKKGQFTDRHAQLAVTYANQVAIALENARLFSDLQVELAVKQDLIAELESKNAELERFTYTVSHDLKSPLFTIRGFLGYLEQDSLSGNRERVKADMQRITDATNKMQQLLNELLELSRVGRMKNESEMISFQALVHDAVELVQGDITKHGVFVQIDENMSDVYGDKQRLIEVIQNLVSNAAKFMGDQPKPLIEIGQDKGDEKNGLSTFYVRDNGIGIPPEHHDRVFGLFNKLDVTSDGTGIGLALVKRIVEIHGGRIWIQSASSPQGEAGAGSTFYFTLPNKPEA